MPAWLGNRHGVRLPYVPTGAEHSYHLFYLLLPLLETRQALIEYLKTRNILAVFHYLPLHLSTMGLQFGGTPVSARSPSE